MKKILVIATRQIGDVLLTTPLVRLARQRWPDAQIDMLGFQGTLGMLAGNPDLNELIETPHRLGAAGLRRLTARLWRRYDLALVTQPSDRAHLLGWIAANKRSVLLAEESSSNWWKKLLAEHVVTQSGDRGDRHVAVEKLALLTPWVPEVSVRIPAVNPPAQQSFAQQDLLTPGYIVVHAPSMWDYKQWPIAHYGEVIKSLLARGHQIVLTGSKSERDQTCIAPLRELGRAPQLIDLSGQLNFQQLGQLLQDAALYIGPDTSVSHLAASLGTPMVAVFGPTNPMRWGPWPTDAPSQQPFLRSAPVQTAGNVTLLQGSQSCVPCGRAGCDDHTGSRSECLGSIAPTQVLASMERLLDLQQAPRKRAV